MINFIATMIVIVCTMLLMAIPALLAELYCRTRKFIGMPIEESDLPWPIDCQPFNFTDKE